MKYVSLDSNGGLSHSLLFTIEKTVPLETYIHILQ